MNNVQTNNQPTNATTTSTFKDLIKTTASPSKVLRESFKDSSFSIALQAHAIVLGYQSRARSAAAVLTAYEEAAKGNDPVVFLKALSSIMGEEVETGTKVFSFACRAMARKAK